MSIQRRSPAEERAETRRARGETLSLVLLVLGMLLSPLLYDLLRLLVRVIGRL